MSTRHLTLFVFLAVGTLHPEASAGLLKGPYLENVGPDRITVSFEYDKIVGGRVLYGPGELSMEQEIPEGSGVQSVNIPDLLPGTTYFYRVELFNGCMSRTLTFSTAPDGPEPFNFVVIGDTRTDHPAHSEVVSLVEERAPDFYINTGDLVEDGDYPDLWQIFFDIEHAAMSRMVMWPVMGNHDNRTGTLYDDLFHVDSDSGTSRYYGFEYSNCHFTVINSEEDFSPSSTQYQWIETDLGRARSDPDIQHIFAFYHRPSFSSGWYGHEGLPLVEHLHPLFVEYKVEIVFSGHDHDYERSTVDGVLYIVTGGGGAPYFPTDDELLVPVPDRNPHREVYLGTFHVVECSVRGEGASCRMIDLTRRVRDTFGDEVDPGPGPGDCKPCDGGCSHAPIGDLAALLMLVLFLTVRLVARRYPGA